MAASVDSKQAVSMSSNEVASVKSKEAAASAKSKEAKDETSDSDDSSSSSYSSNDASKLAPMSSIQVKRKLQLTKVVLDSVLTATEGLFEDCDCGDKLQEAQARRCRSS